MVKTEIVIKNDFQKARKLFDDLDSIMTDYSDFVRIYKNNPTYYVLFNQLMNKDNIDTAFLEAFNDKIVQYVNDSSEPDKEEFKLEEFEI